MRLNGIREIVVNIGNLQKKPLRQKMLNYFIFALNFPYKKLSLTLNWISRYLSKTINYLNSVTVVMNFF